MHKTVLYKRLWLSVLYRAIVDLEHKKASIRHDAANFFLNSKSTFSLACSVLELDQYILTDYVNAVLAGTKKLDKNRLKVLESIL